MRVSLWIEFRNFREPLLSTASARVRTYHTRPEQQLTHDTEEARHHDQFPAARTPPERGRLLLSLDTPQEMISEQEETEQSHQLVTVGGRIGAEGDFFRGTALRQPEPNEPDREVQRIVAQDRPQREQNPPPRPVPRQGQLENGT